MNLEGGAGIGAPDLLLQGGFKRGYALDFEFYPDANGHPVPVCLVYRDLVTGQESLLWGDDLKGDPPFDVGDDSLFIAYYASAEASCFLSLGWAVPRYWLDAFAEFRNLTNGMDPICGRGLSGALSFFGLRAIDPGYKDRTRELILSRGPWSDAERKQIIDYSAQDVAGLTELIGPISTLVLGNRHGPQIGLGQAIFRGRYSAATAKMERRGVPIDVELYNFLCAGLPRLREAARAEIEHLGIYEGSHFRQSGFEAYLARHKIAWPRTESGRLATDRATFKEMAKVEPAIAPLAEAVTRLGYLRDYGVFIGADGRNRCMLAPFGSKTGRNQPSNAKSIFGPASFIRRTIRPEPGMAVAYIDYSSQEVAIAAALSGDDRMIAAYDSGDPYMQFAIDAALAPIGATNDTHGDIRAKCKPVVLGVAYGMGAQAAAERLGCPPIEARQLLELHKQTYPCFWAWLQRQADDATLKKRTETCFGWTMQVNDKTKGTTLFNWPMQAHGAEMMRLAAVRALDAGIEVCMPVHDAFLIEAPLDQIEQDVMRMRRIMERASYDVLGGVLEVRTDAKVVRYPDHFDDGRGGEIWEFILEALAESPDAT